MRWAVRCLSALLEAALAAARRGWYVLPIWWVLPDGSCACGDTNEDGKHPIGKHPLSPLVGNGQTSATLDENLIREWWTRYPEANVAAVMGPSGLFALDVDHRDGAEAAIAKLQGAIAKYGPLPDTPQQISGSGQGWHVLFKAPGFAVRGELEHITCRGNNYILLEPSRHKSGGNYQWEQGCSPDDLPVAELPEAWKLALRKPDPIGTIGVPGEDEEPAWLRAIPHEKRLADMRAHLVREEGEVMGVSRPGMCRDVIKTAVRAYAVRDPIGALEAIETLFNPKNEPRYDHDALVDRMVFAYETAHTPEWGAHYEPREVKLAAYANAIGYHPAPPEPQGPVVARDDTLNVLLAAKRTLLRSKKASQLGEGQLLDALERGAPLPVDSDQDSTDVEFAALKAIVKHAPADAQTGELVAFAARSILQSPDELALVIEHLRGQRTAGEPQNDEDVRLALHCSDKGTPLGSGANIELIVRYSEALKGRLRFNEITKEVEVTDGLFAGLRTNALPVAVMNWLSREWQIQCSSNAVGEQLLYVAQTFGSYEPVAEYLESLTWDGTPRIDNWLVTYCRAETVDQDGADITGYVRAVGWRWLVSAVARAVEPGIKVDTVLILEGAQGAKKSTAFDILGGKWFSGSPVDIKNKDGMMLAASQWICELAELASLARSETDAQKQFLTSRVDRFRPPYGKAIEAFQRRCVFAGTVNPEKDGSVDYLRDDTGDRRWWPVRVGDVDTVALARDRDQLWAEALVRFEQGKDIPNDSRKPAHLRWWFEKHEQIDVDKVASHRHGDDSWVDIIMDWAKNQIRGIGGIGNAVRATDRWTLDQVAKGALNMDAKDLKRNEKAVATALRKAGFRRDTHARLGTEGRKRRWYHPDLSVPEVPEAPAKAAQERVVH